jgi:hypothetical protein
VLALLIIGCRIAGVMERVNKLGFAVSGPLQGYIKDEQGFIVHVYLSGEGIICARPRCRGQLRFIVEEGQAASAAPTKS